MTTRPTRIAQTSIEVKKEYKKNGPRLPERQQRQLQRLAELDTRASRFREQEERRRAAKKKREEREKKERDARKQLGVGLATQMVGYSHTQAKLKNGMEAFLGLKKREADDKKRKEMEETQVRKKLESIAEDMDKEPWDDSDGEDAIADLPALDATVHLEGDHWIDDDLDDDSLLEAHALLMSDATDEVLNRPLQPPPPPLPASIPEAKNPVTCKDDPEFLRLHGPINKAIEDTLNLLPESLIELLSQDTSTNLSLWNPAPSLLHKLNPAGLPPHRLRLKVGCVVSLLRDLNTSSELSKSSHLRVLRIEQEWLECLVLDGQLKGTKAFLSRIAFPAKYRNEEQFAFQRKQFPIRVSTKHAHLHESQGIPKSTFKKLSTSGQPPRPTSTFKKPAIPIPKTRATPNSNPSFKVPGLPASSVTRLPDPSKPDIPATSMPDGWDDFLDSGTQIARELSSDGLTPTPQPEAAPAADIFVPLSTQDLDFDMDDLDDAFQPSPKPPNISPQVIATKPNIPRKPPYISPPNPLDKILGRISSSTTTPARLSIAHPPRPPPQPVKRKAPPTPPLPSEPPRKRSPVRPPPVKTSVTPKAIPAPKAFPSFSEFGLSTQDAISFFDDDDDDDDDMAFGSPLLVV